MKTEVLALLGALLAGTVCAGTRGVEVVTPQMQPQPVVVQQAQQCFETVTYDPPPQTIEVVIDPPPQQVQIAVPCPTVTTRTTTAPGCCCCNCPPAQPVVPMVQQSVVSLPIEPQPAQVMEPQVQIVESPTQYVSLEPQPMTVQQTVPPVPVHQATWQPAQICVDGQCRTMSTPLRTQRLFRLSRRRN